MLYKNIKFFNKSFRKGGKSQDAIVFLNQSDKNANSQFTGGFLSPQEAENAYILRSKWASAEGNKIPSRCRHNAGWMRKAGAQTPVHTRHTHKQGADERKGERECEKWMDGHLSRFDFL